MRSLAVILWSKNLRDDTLYCNIKKVAKAKGVYYFVFMIIRRTGVNEPPLAKDLLLEKGISTFRMVNRSPESETEWRSHEKALIYWVMFGVLEVIADSGTGNITAGDMAMFEEGERHATAAGKSGCGFILAEFSGPLPDRI